MSEKVKIKVIKKKELETAESHVEVVKTSKQQSAREMVSTVSNWVSDIQNRKRKETKEALETFFSNRPQPSGV
jgi:DNA-binding HxlR family transcriptional regulator